ncbi:uncharacterized protein [Dermacentor albipictus]|uniref:uncharacterized protein isoform X1 n=1 Tax=Dermacentor albipictus TaxID=60249 RepID=UPI0038FCA73C
MVKPLRGVSALYVRFKWSSLPWLVCLAAQTCCSPSNSEGGRGGRSASPRIYHRLEARFPTLARAVLPVADIAGGPLESCAIVVRLGSQDTAVASICIRPGKPWDPSSLIQLAVRLGGHAVLCSDFNAHHTDWGSRSCTR